ncbi:putative GNAT family acetyltransferase [Phyllobacterium trifolii]|jgi:predicted GNAT family acetyltransferase|uniref:Putative GNAT family acetyltransferase n=1 Tax=Phyllobacterium trifolii TaxID=300193 RepID=A0A839U1A6_9HYPH|nr:GNAT family N-acetyltransferase [Phyllobacterium trifolii]MBB3144408.1 putative GNAT family acetyltransferase [Phyllobacterium trifolii]
MSHVLDRPAWNALRTAHSALAQGSERARRYPPSIVPFAAAADNTAESLEALENLLTAHEVMALVESEAITVPKGLTVVSEAKLVQMIAEQAFERIRDSRIELLTEADSAEMLALATLTKPGPFTLHAQSLGNFWGVKIDGSLVAMAGQRMRQPGFAELSGLCVRPDFQGRGLGTMLFRFVAGEISARNELAYLHVYATNTPAISLYKAMGFRVRSEMNFAIIKRPDQA